MKNLLFTFAFVLLSKFTQFGCVASSSEDQKNIAQLSISSNAIMADDKIIEHSFGLSPNQIDSFGKQLFKDAKQGNFAISVCNNDKNFLDSASYLDPMIYVDRTDYMTYHSFDNNGHIDLVQAMLPLRADPQNDDRFLFNGSNRDGSLLTGSCLNLTSKATNEKLQDEAVKYTRSTGEFVYLFPMDSEFESCGTGISSDGNIIVGQINPQEKTYGFVHHDNKDTIFLKNPQHTTSNHPQAVSDKGEIIVGYVIKNGKEHAVIWLRDVNDNAYHPCLLQDLIMHNCSIAQRQLLKDNHCTYFNRILAVSPDGKAMFVKTSKSDENSSYDKNNIHHVKIIFGTKNIPKNKDKIILVN